MSEQAAREIEAIAAEVIADERERLSIDDASPGFSVLHSVDEWGEIVGALLEARKLAQDLERYTAFAAELAGYASDLRFLTEGREEGIKVAEAMGLGEAQYDEKIADLESMTEDAGHWTFNVNRVLETRSAFVQAYMHFYTLLGPLDTAGSVKALGGDA